MMHFYRDIYLSRTPNGCQNVRAALLQEHGAICTRHHDSGKGCLAHLFGTAAVKTKACKLSGCASAYQ
jgi:hypothetical protein